jgi:hypothetical protein
MKSMQSDQDYSPVYHRSYLLRIWCADQENKANWRATLEDTHTHERFSFACLEQMFAFLIEQSECDSGLRPMK